MPGYGGIMGVRQPHFLQRGAGAPLGNGLRVACWEKAIQDNVLGLCTINAAGKSAANESAALGCYRHGINLGIRLWRGPLLAARRPLSSAEQVFFRGSCGLRQLRPLCDGMSA